MEPVLPRQQAMLISLHLAPRGMACLRAAAVGLLLPRKSTTCCTPGLLTPAGASRAPVSCEHPGSLEAAGKVTETEICPLTFSPVGTGLESVGGKQPVTAGCWAPSPTHSRAASKVVQAVWPLGWAATQVAPSSLLCSLGCHLEMQISLDRRGLCPLAWCAGLPSQQPPGNLSVLL